MHQGSCHCGVVCLCFFFSFFVVLFCNCSLCRRIGGPWVFFEFGTVEIEGHPEHTVAYVQGDRTLSTIHCRSCGCVTHWEPLPPTPGLWLGVFFGFFVLVLFVFVWVR